MKKEKIDLHDRVGYATAYPMAFFLVLFTTIGSKITTIVSRMTTIGNKLLVFPSLILNLIEDSDENCFGKSFLNWRK
jgi:hypothetical protein